MFHVDRVDYVGSGVRCQFCRRELNRRIAYILRDDSGTEFVSGPTCVSTRAHIDKKSALYPDFTKVAAESPEEGHAKAKPTAAAGKAHRAKKEGYEEVEYLCLRYQKLKNFPGMRLKSLDPVYERYTKGQFSAEDRKHLAALINKVREERPEYSPENLSACYAYSLWIRNALEELPAGKHDFLKKMYLLVLKRMYLSPSQAAAVNNWLSKIPGAPTLDPDAFRQGPHRENAEAAREEFNS